jgi:hypothetical protein
MSVQNSSNSTQFNTAVPAVNEREPKVQPYTLEPLIQAIRELGQKRVFEGGLARRTSDDATLALRKEAVSEANEILKSGDETGLHAIKFAEIVKKLGITSNCNDKNTWEQIINQQILCRPKPPMTANPPQPPAHSRPKPPKNTNDFPKPPMTANPPQPSAHSRPKPPKSTNLGGVLPSTSTNSNSGVVQAFSRDGNGNSCFVNTALQIILHIPALRALFNTTLEQRPNELPEDFQNRSKVQELGNQLIKEHSQGQANVGSGGALSRFIQAVNLANGAKQGSKEYIEIDKGSDASGLISNIFNLLKKEDAAPLFLPITPMMIGKHVNGQQGPMSLQEQVKKNQFPPILEVNNVQRCQSPAIAQSEDIIIDNVTYRLQALAYSSSWNTKNHSGHVKPAIRTESSDFVFIDDMSPEIKKLSKSEVLDTLTAIDKWEVAYYVKVSE